jgi:hypothetical protein
MLGIDDWSWKKGQIYGTLLVDLERSKPIELLADRREETVKAWLLTHPEIEVDFPRSGRSVCRCGKKRRPSSATDCRQISSAAQPAREAQRTDGPQTKPVTAGRSNHLQDHC